MKSPKSTSAPASTSACAIPKRSRALTMRTGLTPRRSIPSSLLQVGHGFAFERVLQTAPVDDRRFLVAAAIKRNPSRNA